MARKRVREYDLKRIFYKYFGSDYQGVLISDLKQLDILDKLLDRSKRYVVKADEMFNKRQKTGLVGLNLDIEQVKEFIRKNYGYRIYNGEVRHFLVEEFIPHSEEKYLAIISEREGDRILYSDSGGVDIEEKWDTVQEEFVPQGKLSEQFPEIHKFCIDMDISYLEINPYTEIDGKIVPLGMLAEFDDYAHFRAKWDIEFPEPFEKGSYEEEKMVEELDKNTGASFKFTILNPNGSIWLMTAGGGASVVFLDSIYLAGYGKEIANYAEYSGNPTITETYEYAKIFFRAMFRSPSKPKVLVLGGGIANFTDVSKTFDGIIKAILEYKEQFLDHQVRIIVRRGGPNADVALKKIQQEIGSLGIPIEVYDENYNIDWVVDRIKI
ncbi:MAG: ATP citrate lyase citrate-binding domain-containing protein [Candidatus Anstonellales archaeon]